MGFGINIVHRTWETMGLKIKIVYRARGTMGFKIKIVHGIKEAMGFKIKKRLFSDMVRILVAFQEPGAAAPAQPGSVIIEEF